ncbi:MAG: hypothetical protein AAF291_06650 [Pseudomonadota bacterium]
MEYSSVLAVWAVAIAGPCIISWLAGDLIGSARTRNLFTDTGSAGEAHSDSIDWEADAYRVEDWRIPGLVHPLSSKWGEDEAEPQRAPTLEEQAQGAERRRERRADQLHIAPSETKGVPMTRGDVRTPQPPLAQTDVERILRRYEESVAALHRSNRVAAAHARQADELDQTIRLTMAAPVRLTSTAQDLYLERVRY